MAARLGPQGQGSPSQLHFSFSPQSNMISFKDRPSSCNFVKSHLVGKAILELFAKWDDIKLPKNISENCLNFSTTKSIMKKNLAKLDYYLDKTFKEQMDKLIESIQSLQTDYPSVFRTHLRFFFFSFLSF
jgi:hypothetical protein